MIYRIYCETCQEQLNATPLNSDVIIPLLHGMAWHDVTVTEMDESQIELGAGE